MKDTLEDDIRFQIPIKISYSALESFLREQLVGEYISTTDAKGEETRYAEILNLDLARSLEQGFDLAMDVKFKTLTTFFRNKAGNILLDLTLDFDPKQQRLSVNDYKFDVQSSSWLLDNSLETLVGTFFREKIKKKMSYDFKPLIEKQLLEINQKLEQNLQPAEGIAISGFVSDFRVLQLLSGEQVLLAIVEVRGKGIVEITSIKIEK